jgi:hypothetical protein
MKLEELAKRISWITKDGSIDLAKLPIEGALKQALSEDHQEFRSGLNVLCMMQNHGSQEAEVFLLGVLVKSTTEENWEKRMTVVEAMKGIRHKAIAEVLFAELRRVKSSNTTRRYLTSVIEVLASLPSEWVLEGFEALASDQSFSYKMRDKFKAALHKVEFGDDGFW